LRALTKELCEKYFDVEDVAVVLGGPKPVQVSRKCLLTIFCLPAQRPLHRMLCVLRLKILFQLPWSWVANRRVIVSETADMKKTAAKGDDGKNA